MSRLKIGYCREELTSNAGLGLIGAAIKKSGLRDKLKKLSFHHGISHFDILVSYIGLLTTGKTYFEAIEGHRDDLYFQTSLLLNDVPSCSRLRQRMDQLARWYRAPIERSALDFMIHAEAHLTPESNGHIPINLDLTLMGLLQSKISGEFFLKKLEAKLN